MKVMLLFMGTAEEAQGDPAELAAAYERIGAWWGEHAAAGRILDGHELRGPSSARKVRITPEGPVVTDGPFAEASEVVGGYAIAEVASMDEAATLAASWPWGGEVEIRPLRDRPGM
jgi:hypothetical protein